MFGFGARCPVDLREKVWVERRLQWLALRFGRKQLLDTLVIEPTPEFFPDEHSSDQQGCETWFARVCELSDCRPDEFQLVVVEPDEQTEFEDPFVALTVDQLADPIQMVASMARGIARVQLLSNGHMKGDEADFFLVMDLLAVCNGFGIFQANSAVKSAAWSNGLIEYWDISFAGYLQARMPGYALGVLNWLRSDGKPKWVGHLCQDAKTAFQSGNKFLTKTGDCLFQAENFGTPDSTASRLTIVDELKSGSDSFKLARLWDSMERPLPFAEISDVFENCLDTREPILASTSAVAAAAYGKAALPLLPKLRRLTEADQTESRVCGILAIAAVRPPLAGEIDDLNPERIFESLLNDRNVVVAEASISALSVYGSEARELVNRTVPLLTRLLKNCDFKRLHRIFDSLEPIVGDLRSFSEEAARDVDPEFFNLLMNEIEQRENPNDDTVDVDTVDRNANSTKTNHTTGVDQDLKDLIRMPVNFNNLAGVSKLQISAPGTFPSLSKDV